MHPLILPARNRAQIKVDDVSLTRGAQLVLSHVDLTVTPSSRIAVVGENGRGKTTLLQTLAGQLFPDSGHVRVTGTIGVAEQEMRTDGGRTVADAVKESIAQSVEALRELDTSASLLAEESSRQATTSEQDRQERRNKLPKHPDYPTALSRYTQALETAEALDAWNSERRVQIALEALNAETNMTRSLGRMSVGERYRVRLACLLGGTDDFLLLDEPTNHLDHSGLDFLATSLKSRKGGVLLVSHDRTLISSIAETILDLDPSPDGRPRVYGNGYQGYREARKAEFERWNQDFQKQQAELTLLKNDLSAAQNRLVSGWRPEKGSPKHGRATRAGGLVQSVHRRREMLEEHRVTVPPPPRVFHFPELSARKGELLVKAEEISVTYRMADTVSLELSGGDRLLVTGPNGAGKSTLLDLVSGDLAPTVGSITRSRKARIGYLRQESHLPSRRRVNEVFAEHVQALVAGGSLRESEAIALSQLGLLESRDQHKRIGELSVGQQRRLDLALVLAVHPHLLLIDEPTNHLSIPLVDELTEAVLATPVAVVLSTHDRKLLRDVEGWPSLELRPVAHG